MSEMCTVEFCIEVSVGGSLHAVYTIGIRMSPNGDIDLIVLEGGGGIGSGSVSLRPDLSTYVDVLPQSSSNSDVDEYGTISDVGGVIPYGGGTIGGDALYSEEGELVGCSYSSSIGDPTPEIHWEVS